MDYEKNYEDKKINYHFLAIIGISILIVGVMFYPIFKSSMIVKEPVIVNITPENISTVIQIEYVTVLVTPTIDGQTYFASEYQEGIRKIKRPFSFYRDDVVGKQDMSIHISVYDYKIFNSYHWFNPQDYKYYEEHPINRNNKFLFVFINVYSDDVIGNDVRPWYFDERHFGIQINDMLYMPIDFEKQLRIRELENTYTMNDVERVEYYASDKIYSSASTYRKTAGETYNNITYIRGGESNNVDGYLVYEIPYSAKDEDLLAVGSFNAFGNAQWKLKP